jgi:hypothetical protein
MVGSELAGPRTDNQDDGIEAVSDRVLGQNLFHQLAQISDELPQLPDTIEGKVVWF